MEKYSYYYCTITFGNISEIETQEHYEYVNKFLSCFPSVKFEINKIEDDDVPYYIAKIQYKSVSQRKTTRFAASLTNFAFYHAMGYAEYEVGFF